MSTPGGIRLAVASPDDWERHRAIRLEGLLSAPDAFGSTHAKEVDRGEQDWRRGLADAWIVHALDDGMPPAALGVAGLAQLTGPDRTGEFLLWGMYVQPRARGTGTAKDLVRAVLAQARARGAERVTLDVTSGNAAAIRLYEQCGFVLTGQDMAHPRRDDLRELEMRADLSV